MGNVQVQYKQRRDGNAAGTEVKTPLDYMKMLFGDQDAWNNTTKMFAEMPADKQNEFKAVFGSDDVIGNFQTAGMWITENEEEEDVLQETMEKLQAIMKSCPPASSDVL